MHLIEFYRRVDIVASKVSREMGYDIIFVFKTIFLFRSHITNP